VRRDPEHASHPGSGAVQRVSYFGFHVADVRTPGELERYFPLSELETDALIRADVAPVVLPPGLRAIAQAQLHQPSDADPGEDLRERLIQPVPGQHSDTCPRVPCWACGDQPVLPRRPGGLARGLALRSGYSDTTATMAIRPPPARR